MVELTAKTKAHIRALFPAGKVPEAMRLLVEDCSGQLPFAAGACPASRERIWFAALRVSGGDLARLREAIRLARVDWRDLLVAALFATDTRAHERWQPQRFDKQILDLWLSGELPSGVLYRRREKLTVTLGQLAGKQGTAIALTGLEPEPSYVVRLGPHHDATLPQSWLRRAD